MDSGRQVIFCSSNENHRKHRSHKRGKLFVLAVVNGLHQFPVQGSNHSHGGNTYVANHILKTWY